MNLVRVDKIKLQTFHKFGWNESSASVALDGLTDNIKAVL